MTVMLTSLLRTSRALAWGVLLGNGSGGFSPAVSYASGASFLDWVVVDDFNNGGHSDLAVENEGSNGVGVLLGNGSLIRNVSRPSGASAEMLRATHAALCGDFSLAVLLANVARPSAR